MKNFYEATCKKSVLLGLGELFLLAGGVVLSFGASAQQIVTYDTTFDGWNAVVTMDKALTGNDSAAGIVFFPGIGQETTDSADIVVNGPHYLIRNGIWDGSVSLGNGVHHPFIISLQPPASGYPASTVMPKIAAILARYRIKRNSFYLTGLSMGGWYANQFVCYEPTPGDDTYGHLVRALVVLEGVEPADSTGLYPSLSYPRKMGHYAKACGGRELWVEGSNDWRDMLAGAQNMCDSVPNTASYFQVTYGGGAHCCWNTEYDPSTTWTLASNSNISQVWGTPQAMNVWQWLLRQGDTSMPTYSTPPPPVNVAPTVSAGVAQTIQLPVSSVTLSGTATGNGGATIVSTDWTEVSGPVTATIAIASVLSTAVSGMTTAGSYVFQLKATDNHGLSDTSTVTITVEAAASPPPPPPPPAHVPPVANAGAGQTVTLPTDSVTLNGSGSYDTDGTITGYSWVQLSGNSGVTLAGVSEVQATASGLTAGTYVFQLTVTDSTGATGVATVTITVDAAPAVPPPPPVQKDPPVASAGNDTTISMPADSVILNGGGSMDPNGEALTYQWMQVSGPTEATIGSPGTAMTWAGGLNTGLYVFSLMVTDTSGLSDSATVQVRVVNPQRSAGVDTGSAAFGVYPNPVEGMLTVRLTDPNTSGPVLLRVFDMKGRLIVSEETDVSGGQLVNLDVAGLSKGVYALQVVAGKASSYQLIVRQ